MRQISSFLRRFRADERGAFLAMFGLLAIVLIATAGAVVDYTSVQQARTRAQVALDAAALALQPMINDDEWTTEEIRTAAEDLMIERIGDASIVASVTSAVPDPDTGTLTLTATLNVPMNFVALVGVDDMDVGIASVSARGSSDIEVAIALDITQSMAGSKIEALEDATGELIDLVVKDQQEPTYSKMALVPYSNGVNLGAYADLARGVPTGYTAITGASWLTAASAAHRTINAITKANPARLTTSVAHGFSTGDIVNISNVAGGGFTALNGMSVAITVTSTTQFTLNGVNSIGYSGTYTANSGRVTTGSARIASAITKANPGVVTTTMAHGLNTGDAIVITSAAGGAAFTALNNREFVITRVDATRFSLNANVSGGGTYTANSAIIRKCQTSECEVVITSNNHGLANNELVYITNVSGMTQLNNQPPFTVSDRTTNTYVLENSDGLVTSAYTSGGRSYCTRVGCYYYYFTNNSGTYELWPISTCVTERVGANQYTDAAPSTTYVGRSYPSPDASLGYCPSLQIVPLTDDKETLHDLADDLTTTGSTAGQTGLAWAWYMLSTNFAYMWPADSQPAEPNPDLIKVVILMTDGAFNTAYCNGVTSKNYGVVGNADKINCNATNGNPFTQAETLCEAIKNGPDGEEGGGDDIILYTVAFDLGNDDDAIDLMEDCATDAGHSYTAEDAADLSNAFNAIGRNISTLRLIN
jgi:Flp pilus assembly protein TadG